MSLKRAGLTGRLNNQPRVTARRFSLSRISLRRFPFPSAPTIISSYIEDVFSTYLYTGNSDTQSIANGIRLGDGATSEGWIATLSSPNTAFNVYGEEVAIDSAGNVYVCGTQYGVGHNFQIAKYNSTGTLLWQKTIANVYYAYSITVDSNDNVYVSGIVTIGGTDEAFLIKLDSSGDIQWQRVLGGLYSQEARSVKIDSSGNVYIAGTTGNASSGYDLLLAKYDASGTLQWQRLLGLFGTSNNFGYDLALDSSGNPHICGVETVSTRYRMFVAKYDTSGVFQWQRRLTGSDTDDRGQGVAVDSAGNVYVCGFTNSGGSPGSFNSVLVKYNSSGVLQWQRTLGLNYPKQDFGYSVTVDNSDNLFICGYTNSFDTDKAFIAKYNSSGVLQWQRILGRNTSDVLGSTYAYSIKIDNAGSMYICGNLQAGTPNSPYRIFIAKLPVDGTGTGAYSVGGYTYRYEESTLTNAASTFSNTAGALNNTAASFSNTSNTFTTTTSNLISSLATVSTGTGYGGMVWMKSRSAATDHAVYDTVRGATKDLGTNLTTAETTQTTGLTSFNNNGFTLGTLTKLNTGGGSFTSWTFRKQAKFFDVVTFTTSAAAAHTFNHNLGSTPGFVIIKATSTGGAWYCYHTSLGVNKYLILNSTAASATNPSGNWAATSTTFTVPTDFLSGGTQTYVAYLFAHNAGGFGDLGTDNVISCGTYLGSNHRSKQIVELGFEPQWVMIKNVTSSAQRWVMVDNIRGMSSSASARDSWLAADATTAETNLSADQIVAAPTGFYFNGTESDVNEAGSTFVYIAIRRGPMRTPTDVNNLFQPIVYTGDNLDNRLKITGILTDMIMARQRNSSTVAGFVVGDRLRGDEYLLSGATNIGLVDADSLMSSVVSYGNSFSVMNGFGVGNDPTSQLNFNTTSENHVAYAFARAPKFFDVTSYIGDATARTITHNLSAVPELMIIKNRSDAQNWAVYLQKLGSARRLFFDVAQGPAHASSDIFNTTDPTSTVFSVGNDGQTNSSTHNFVAYLFATLPGISKIGTYAGIGAGTSQQIDCGFTSGARFVLIKRIDGVSGDDWFVWDVARGLTSNNDPYLRTSSAGVEVTNTDYIEPSSAGFEVSNSASSVINDVGVATWTTRTSTFSLTTISAVTYGNNTFVATGYSGKAATSNSGIDWVARTISGATDRYLSVVYGDGPGLFATCGTDLSTNLLSTSPDGITWTGRSTSLSSSICNSLNGITYGSGTFVAVGANAKIISSTTGTTWTSRTNGFGTSAINAVTYGDNQFVAVGTSGKIATSNDGITWTQQTNSNTSSLGAVVYGNGLYVAGGSSGVILTSPDAVTWTLRTSGFGGDSIQGLSYGEGVFVAVGTAGKLATSSDGVTWTARTSGFSTSPIFETTYGKAMFINVGDNGILTTAYPNNYIYLAIA